MLSVVRQWIERYFADEEAIILLVLLAAGLIVVITLGHIIAPVVASVIIAFLLQGVVNWLERYRVPHGVAVLMATLLLLSSFLALLLVVLPITWTQLTALFNELPSMLSNWQAALMLLPEKYPSIVTAKQIDQWIGLAQNGVGDVGQWVLSFSLSSLPGLMALLVYLVLIPVMVFFLLKDRTLIIEWLIGFLPERHPVLTAVWTEMNEQFANYIRGKVIEILIVGIVTYVTFVFTGLNYAALLGLLVGLSVLIPYIGATVVTIPVLMIGYFQWGWTDQFFYMFLAYSVVQILDGNVLVPLLFSEAVNLHPLAIILAVLFFGGLWGFWGVFFAIPLATLVKALLHAWPHTGRLQALAQE